MKGKKPNLKKYSLKEQKKNKKKDKKKKRELILIFKSF